jgi:gamma-glutamyltranspeptidase/glutathione hydrolase
MRKFAYLLIAILFSTGCTQNSSNQPATVYSRGLVVCAYPDAARIGLDILKKGGNAVDAAVAVQFALAVCYPEAGNIGGGGFMVYRGEDGRTAALDFREKAPAGAKASMFLDANGRVIENKSLNTASASGVPGSVDGMFTAHARFGKMPWAILIQPAIDLAEKGFRLSKNLAADINTIHDELKKLNPYKSYFLKRTPWQEGDTLLQPDLAVTLKLIRDKGRDGFYSGLVAEEISHEMQYDQGLITREDLASYHSIWREPVNGTYKGYTIISMPPPSSGGIALIQLLHSVEKYPLSRWGFHADSTVQLMVEAERRVYADRSKWLGDPDFFKVPEDSLLNPDYSDKRMATMNWDSATPSSSIQPGSFSLYESHKTTHFSIVDSAGNAVSVTTTINDNFGSKIVVNGAGFLLNNEMDDFSIKPGVPNMFGLIGGKANSIEPNKRMLSSMTPTIVEKDGRLFMVIGTPGGGTIITSVFQTLLNVLDFKEDIQTAVGAGRFHFQWLPDSVDVESGALDTALIVRLSKKGYRFYTDYPSIGAVDAILKTDKGYEGGADPRGDDTKAGW